MNNNIEEVIIRPEGSLQILSHQEAKQLCDATSQGLNDILRRCALAVLNTGSDMDSATTLLELHKDFAIEVNVKGRGVQVTIRNAPCHAFVDGDLMVGLKEHLFAVIRDLIYSQNEVLSNVEIDLNSSSGITNAVFLIARNAQLMIPKMLPNIVVFWGGHSIPEHEYKYSKHLGYEFGLRNLDICTGCGPGVMKGPMKGAILGHGKQRNTYGRYLGLSEPGIIAAEAPNAFVNELCIMPDIEKRLEAFVRIGHGIVILPGGPGTMEELLYLLSILLHPQNQNLTLPIVLSGDANSANYFKAVIDFINLTLGEVAANKLKVFINRPTEVAKYMKQQMEVVRQDRKKSSDAYYFNWRIHLDLDDHQLPFMPTHDNMAKLNLHKDQPAHLLASQLRKAFSGIVAGNVKDEGIKEIEKYGVFELHGDKDIMQAMDKLLKSFISQKRMKIGDDEYKPCYKIRT